MTREERTRRRDAVSRFHKFRILVFAMVMPGHPPCPGMTSAKIKTQHFETCEFMHADYPGIGRLRIATQVIDQPGSDDAGCSLSQGYRCADRSTRAAGTGGVASGRNHAAITKGDYPV